MSTLQETQCLYNCDFTDCNKSDGVTSDDSNDGGAHSAPPVGTILYSVHLSEDNMAEDTVVQEEEGEFKIAPLIY